MQDPEEKYMYVNWHEVDTRLIDIIPNLKQKWMADLLPYASEWAGD